MYNMYNFQNLQKNTKTSGKILGQYGGVMDGWMDNVLYMNAIKKTFSVADLFHARVCGKNYINIMSTELEYQSPAA